MRTNLTHIELIHMLDEMKLFLEGKSLSKETYEEVRKRMNSYFYYYNGKGKEYIKLLE